MADWWAFLNGEISNKPDAYIWRRRRSSAKNIALMMMKRPNIIHLFSEALKE